MKAKLLRTDFARCRHFRSRDTKKRSADYNPRLKLTSRYDLHVVVTLWRTLLTKKKCFSLTVTDALASLIIWLKTHCGRQIPC